MKKQKRKLLRFSRRRIIVASVIGAVIVIGIASLVIWSVIKSHDTDIDTNSYQAVFLTNGQVYFGKLQPFTGGNLKLTHVFYLQKSSGNESANPQDSSDTGDVQLIKLGSEVHAPQDEMVISKAQVLFYENVKSSGSVAQSIAKYDTAH